MSDGDSISSRHSGEKGGKDMCLKFKCSGEFLGEIGWRGEGEEKEFLQISNTLVNEN